MREKKMNRDLLLAYTNLESAKMSRSNFFLNDDGFDCMFVDGP